jgi:hypothetical protein
MKLQQGIGSSFDDFLQEEGQPEQRSTIVLNTQNKAMLLLKLSVLPKHKTMPITTT